MYNDDQLPTHQIIINEDYIEVHLATVDEAKKLMKKNPLCRFIAPIEGEERCAVLYPLSELATGGVNAVIKRAR